MLAKSKQRRSSGMTAVRQGLAFIRTNKGKKDHETNLDNVSNQVEDKAGDEEKERKRNAEEERRRQEQEELRRKDRERLLEEQRKREQEEREVLEKEDAERKAMEAELKKAEEDAKRLAEEEAKRLAEEASMVVVSADASEEEAAPVSPEVPSEEENAGDPQVVDISMDSLDSQCTFNRMHKSPYLHDLPPETPTCSNKYVPNLHTHMAGCQVCLFRLTVREREDYERKGRHLRVVMTKGGCRGCHVFPSGEGEDPVRICKQCFFNTHLQHVAKRASFRYI